MRPLSLLSYTVQGLTPGNGSSHFQTSVKAIKTVPTGMPTETLAQVTVGCVRLVGELAITVTREVMCKRLHRVLGCYRVKQPNRVHEELHGCL